jgi:hypothetical protein
VVVEGVAAKGENHQISPAGVGGRLRLEDDRDEKANVLNPPGLVVELGHERVRRIMPEDGGVVDGTSGRGRGGTDVPGGGWSKELLRLGDLASQSVGRVALALPHESRRTHTSLAFRGSSTGSHEGGSESGIGPRGAQRMRATETEKVQRRSSSTGSGTSGVASGEEWLNYPCRRCILGSIPHRAQIRGGGKGLGSGGIRRRSRSPRWEGGGGALLQGLPAGQRVAASRQGVAGGQVLAGGERVAGGQVLAGGKRLAGGQVLAGGKRGGQRGRAGSGRVGCSSGAGRGSSGCIGQDLGPGGRGRGGEVGIERGGKRRAAGHGGWAGGRHQQGGGGWEAGEEEPNPKL